MAEKQTSDIIYSVGGKNKFFDMRNALSLANVEDYAMLHGVGGAKHAYSSGIMFSITDYSGRDSRTGKGSKFVSANVDPYRIDEILSVCRKNSGYTTGGEKSMSDAFTVLNAKLDLVCKGLASAFDLATKACGRIITKKGNANGPYADFGQVLRSARDAVITKPKPEEILQLAIAESTTEYSFHQDKVNVYKVDQNDGFVFVTVVDISRRRFNEKGELRKYPWVVSIKNLWAPPIKKENGTTAYSASNARDVVECFMQISDDDMYRCCWTAEHFIRVWENANAIPLVLEGLQRREKNRRSSNF